MNARLEGKIVLVTGANSGIGLETAVGLARMGAHVAMVCRDPEKGAAARDDVVARSENERITLHACDLSSFSSIRAFVEDFTRRFDRVDVLVNNAGVYMDRRVETVDGFETTFGTNHLGTFLLTNLLLPSLRAAKRARVVTVSSALHRRGRVRFDDLDARRSFSGPRAYSDSKLMNVLFAYHLARKLEGTGVTSNVLHPGVIRTNLVSKNGSFLSFLFGLARPFFKSAETGARTSLLLASAPELEGVTGRWFEDERERRSSRASYDTEVQGRLWEVSESLIAARPKLAAA